MEKEAKYYWFVRKGATYYVTIPKNIREKMGLKEGDLVEVTIRKIEGDKELDKQREVKQEKK